ncbi:neurofascin-like [Tubulanus polymorphus]|uniref:neurofascin-like n=1 Tax=Tubulanus polymorphus TaxID=672921 RepID=UPI003DA4E450
MSTNTPRVFIAAAILFWLTVTVASRNLEDIEDRRPPTIAGGMSGKPVYISSGSDGESLFCGHIDGSPTPTVEWFKDDERLLTDPELPPQLRRNYNTTTITVKSDEPGTYYCMARNKWGVSKSVKVEVGVEEISRKQKVESYGNKTVKLYDSFELKCDEKQIVGVTPVESTNYHWTFGSMNNDITPKPIPVDPNRYVKTENGDLIVSHAEVDDSTTGQHLYVCNIWGITSGKSASLHPIKVLDDTNQHTTKPVALKYPVSEGRRNMNPRPTLNGSAIMLPCLFTGIPYVAVDWYREAAGNGRQSVSSGQSVNGSQSDSSMEPVKVGSNTTSLKIGDGGADMVEGIYYCKPRRQDEPRAYYNVTIEQKPEWISKPKNVLIFPKEEAVFECKAKGKPQPAISWIVDGVDYEPGKWIDSQANFTVTDESFAFTSMRDDVKFKVVQCQALNEHGAIISPAYVGVMDRIEVANNTNKAMDAKKQVDPIKLPCLLWYDRLMPPSVEWSRNGTSISESEKGFEVKPLSRGNELVIDPGKFDKADPWLGKYVCKASSGREKASVEHIIRRLAVEKPAPAIGKQTNVMPAMPLWLIIVIIVGGILFIVIVIVIVYRIADSRRNGADYPVDKLEKASGNDPKQELKDTGFRDFSPKNARPAQIDIDDEAFENSAKVGIVNPTLVASDEDGHPMLVGSDDDNTTQADDPVQTPEPTNSTENPAPEPTISTENPAPEPTNSTKIPAPEPTKPTDGLELGAPDDGEMGDDEGGGVGGAIEEKDVSPAPPASGNVNEQEAAVDAPPAADNTNQQQTAVDADSTPFFNESAII